MIGVPGGGLPEAGNRGSARQMTCIRVTQQSQKPNFFLFNIYLCIYLAVPGLHGDMWILVP